MDARNTDSAKALLASASEAAKQLRKERSVWRRILEWWAACRADMARKAIERACRRGDHVLRGWRKIGQKRVFDHAVSTEIPTATYDVYQGNCTHCGEPETKRVRV